MRFRTSTNSEDLDGFPCAGCYESHTGDPADWTDVLDAVRETYASAWLFRTFEERSYYGIDHSSVGMALLVHHNFPDEEANGVAVTNNPFDASGHRPGLLRQRAVRRRRRGGGTRPRAPTSDQFLYYFDQPNQPSPTCRTPAWSPPGATVLSSTQVHELGTALTPSTALLPAYGPASGNDGWYAMDVEFKFDDEATPAQPPTLYIKQARPYPGRGD
jgi:hypothetical protein